MPDPIHIATRKSTLARRQTSLARTWLEKRLPDAVFEILPLHTEVDKRLQWSLEKRGGIGLFTKELEEALLEERAHLAVHSAKDLPTRETQSLEIVGYLPRARANDILVRRSNAPQPQYIASSSPRRRAQASLLYPKAAWTSIRGNVGTRLRKIEEGEADATLLAAAGLDRLGIESHEGLAFEPLSIRDSVPAPGQGAIAVQCRKSDRKQFDGLFCSATLRAVTLERAFLRRLGGGCQTPVGVHYEGETLHVFHPDTGYRAFQLPSISENTIESSLDSIFTELKL